MDIDMVRKMFGMTTEKAVETIKETASLMKCDYKTAYDEYTHEVVKTCFKWEEIEPFLK